MYVLTKNGDFQMNYNDYSNAIRGFDIIVDNLMDGEVNMANVVLEECSIEVFNEYVLCGYDDCYLRDNSKKGVKEY